MLYTHQIETNVCVYVYVYEYVLAQKIYQRGFFIDKLPPDILLSAY